VFSPHDSCSHGADASANTVVKVLQHASGRAVTEVMLSSDEDWR